MTRGHGGTKDDSDAHVCKCGSRFAKRRLYEYKQHLAICERFRPTTEEEVESGPRLGTLEPSDMYSVVPGAGEELVMQCTKCDWAKSSDQYRDKNYFKTVRTSSFERHFKEYHIPRLGEYTCLACRVGFVVINHASRARSGGAANATLTNVGQQEQEVHDGVWNEVDSGSSRIASDEFHPVEREGSRKAQVVRPTEPTAPPSDRHLELVEYARPSTPPALRTSSPPLRLTPPHIANSPINHAGHNFFDHSTREPHFFRNAWHPDLEE
ncbi:uncharacterized protein JCM6883_005920 [Sporobolomyces salmoneus]|uniref:uncharacterized protein n=1 Tax=Sporobolomyces salmoneus TaxID=183962 RepID=UPI0031704919